jgi:hypothetical protein
VLSCVHDGGSVLILCYVIFLNVMLQFLASLGFESGKSGFVVTFDLDHLAMVINAIPDIR